MKQKNFRSQAFGLSNSTITNSTIASTTCLLHLWVDEILLWRHFQSLGRVFLNWVRDPSLQAIYQT